VAPGTAYLMSTMLADVMDRGTGTGARAAGFKLLERRPGPSRGAEHG